MTLCRAIEDLDEIRNVRWQTQYHAVVEQLERQQTRYREFVQQLETREPASETLKLGYIEVFNPCRG